MKYLLVSGSREMYDPSPIENVFREFDPDMLIEGGANGADRLAFSQATQNGVGVETYEAEWGKYGRVAGPCRNSRMVDRAVELVREGHEVLVVCFPGPKSRGTWDLHRKAVKSGLNVRVVRVPR